MLRDERPRPEVQYTGHFLNPDSRYSFPTGLPEEGLYQILQPILQKESFMAKPEIYEGFLDENPEPLLSFLDLSFRGKNKVTNNDGITRLKDAYDGKVQRVPFDQEHLLFSLTKIESTRSSLEFIATAFASEVEADFGQPTIVHLHEVFPYFVFYVMAPKVDETSNFSFNTFITKQFEVAKAEPGVQTVIQGLELSTQLFTILRGYASTVRS